MKRNKILTPLSKRLRKNMTKEERRLWYTFLKTLPITVHRQYIIGTYIADFYIASKSIIIELDGGGHYKSEQEEYDQQRNQYMVDQGLTVLRYSNTAINQNFNGVCEDILQKLELSKK